MSLLSFEEIPGNSSSINQEYLRHSTRTFQGLFGPDDDEVYVIDHCGHAISEAHPSDPHQRLLEIKADLIAAQTTNPATNGLAKLWKLVFEYGPWNILDWPLDGNPVNLPLRFRIDFTTAEVAALVDVDGNPIVNSAGDPYDPPLTREVTRATLTVKRNESPASVNLSTLAALSNTLNAAVWNAFPIKTVRLNPIKLPDIEYSQATNTFYFPIEYVFDINFDTWVKQVVNAGFRELDADGNLIPILINGVQPSTPVPLDEDGHKILTPEFKDSTGDVPDDTDPGGYSGEVAGGGEPPEGGTGVATGSNLVIDAYDLIRTSDFTALHLDSIFTLPTL
jgi:hypothetical protein